MREQFYLDMLQKRLASDDSSMLTFNRSVIHDMLAVFGRQHTRYQDAKGALRQYACWCPDPCGPTYWDEDYCGYKAAKIVGEKDGSDEASS